VGCGPHHNRQTMVRVLGVVAAIGLLVVSVLFECACGLEEESTVDHQRLFNSNNKVRVGKSSRFVD